MAANNRTSIRDLALAALARPHGEKRDSGRDKSGTDVGQASQGPKLAWDKKIESVQSDNPLSHCPSPLGAGQRDTPQKSGTALGTVAGQCAQCGQPGGLPVAYGDRQALVHPHCRNAWRAAQDAIFDQRLRLVAGSSQ